MVRTIVATLALMLAAGSAEACKVEAWRWYHTASIDTLTIEGATTCAKGRLMLRVYEGKNENRRFLGIDGAYIRGHTFTGMVDAIKTAPKAVSIEYAVEPE